MVSAGALGVSIATLHASYDYAYTFLGLFTWLDIIESINFLRDNNYDS